MNSIEDIPPSPISSCERSGNVEVVVEIDSTMPIANAPGTSRPMVNLRFPRSAEQAVISAQPIIADPLAPHLGPVKATRAPWQIWANTKAMAVRPARVPISYVLISPRA
jgi:hypothetical protein